MSRHKINETVERLNKTKLVVPSKYEILGEKRKMENNADIKVKKQKPKITLNLRVRILSARKIPAAKYGSINHIVNP
jgi:hypothetical protein